MPALKLTSVGTSTGTGHSQGDASASKSGKRDMLHVIETGDGYLLTPYDEALERQLAIGRRIMKDNRELFRALPE
jgi:hypothetical protein